MTNDEARAILKTMSALFFNVPFKTEDPDSLKIYLKQLTDLDYKTCDKALDDLVKTNKFCPSISEIRERYFSLKKHSNTILKDNATTCKECNNKGFIIFTKMIADYTKEREPYPMQYAAYCDKCNKGKDYAYDGSKCEKYASKYHISPISSYLMEVKA